MGLPFNIINFYGFITYYVYIKFRACLIKKFRLCDNVDHDQAQLHHGAYVHVCLRNTKKKHGYLSRSGKVFYAHFAHGCEKFFN